MQTNIRINFLELFKSSWKKIKPQFIKFAAVFVLIVLLSELSDRLIQDDESLLAVFTGIVFFILQPWFALGLIKMSLNIHDGKSISIYDFSFDIWHIGRYVGLAILNTVIILLFLLLFIVPGIIAGITLSFAVWFFVDKDLTIFESLSSSQKYTRGHKWELFLFYIIIIIFNLFGALLFGIGLIFTAPISMIMMASVYRLLDDKSILVSRKVVTKKSVAKPRTTSKDSVKKSVAISKPIAKTSAKKSVVKSKTKPKASAKKSVAKSKPIAKTSTKNTIAKSKATPKASMKKSVGTKKKGKAIVRKTKKT